MTSGAWTDHSTTVNHASLVGSPTVDTDGLLLSGSGQYGQIASVSALDFASAFTIAAWVKLDAFSTSGVRGIICRRNSSEWWALYDRYYNPSSRPLRFECDDGPDFTAQTFVNPLASTDWMHLAVSFAGGSYTLYLDGTPVATQTGSCSIACNNFASPIYLGYDSATGASSAMDGRLDDVQIYDTNLDADAIADLVANSPGSHA